MSNITLKEVPSALHDRLKEVAEESGRSINKLIIHELSQALLPHKSSRLELVERIKERRGRMKYSFTLDEMLEAKNEGRV